ncbi:hypothetical protein MUK42_05199 [Musa troglodytarum]|uniref:Uncharacterized protein n=1 Tax=Musa troglodytarum TaxID=320322 RepID=A0A9E7EK98_9LILI|nr:hypothetical protein MUK42_05199 [Musa troglodytarum]URD78994.1 hypothetical protein MUK42_05199 [Musa troglodytarum]
MTAGRIHISMPTTLVQPTLLHHHAAVPLRLFCKCVCQNTHPALLSSSWATVAPATLALGPCAGFSPNRTEVRSFDARPSFPLPPDSSHLKAGSSRGGIPRLREKLCLSPLPTVRAVAVDSDQLGSSEPARAVSCPSKQSSLVPNLVSFK